MQDYYKVLGKLGQLHLTTKGRCWAQKGEREIMRFLNYYRCPHDGTQWHDTWTCQCNDRCPTCDAEIEPYDSEDLDPDSDGTMLRP